MDTRGFFWEVNYLGQEVNHLPLPSTFPATICLHYMKTDDFTFYLDSKKIGDYILQIYKSFGKILYSIN
jgi:hypothetical protein